jgi:ABC-2 type transport system permease protein
MSKTWLIIKREYITRVRKRSFLIMTLLGPLLFGGLMVGAILIGMSDEARHNVLILDQSGVLSVESPANGKLISRFPLRFQDEIDNSDQIPKLRYSFTRDTDYLDRFDSSEFSLMVLIDAESINAGDGILYYKKLPSITAKENIRSEVEGAIEEFRVRDSLAIDYEKYKRIKRPFNFEREVNVLSNDLDTHKHQRGLVGFGFAVIIYLFIFLYSVQVMRGVIEEKTNRIVEVIISSVKPFQLMIGKIVGVGLVGLSQFLLWVLLCFIVTLAIVPFLGESMSAAASMNGSVLDQGHLLANTGETGNEMVDTLLSMPWRTMIFSFIFYFLGGYFFYGSLMAAVGAAVDAETDTQQFMLPVTMPLVFGFIVAEFMLQNPDGSIGDIFGIIPFTSPIVMMVKTPMGVSAGYLFVSIITLIAAFLCSVWFASKIYRTGILMYGKKASYKELWKWLFYKD